MKGLRLLLAGLLLASPASAANKGVSVPKIQLLTPAVGASLPAVGASVHPVDLKPSPVGFQDLSPISMSAQRTTSAPLPIQAAEPAQPQSPQAREKLSPEQQAAQGAAKFDGAAKPQLSEQQITLVDSVPQAIQLMRRHHLAKPEASKLAPKALRGMLVASGKTSYKQAVPYFRALRAALSPNVRGMGFTLDRNEQGQWTVKNVFSGSPAHAAGLLKNDVVDAIDGVPLWNKTEEEIRAAFAPGQKRVVRLGRADEEGRVDFHTASLTAQAYVSSDPQHVSSSLTRFFRAVTVKLAHVEPVNLVEAALTGLGRSLDMFTRYESSQGSRSDEPPLGGVGLMFKPVPGGVRVTGVLPGAPAHRAGIVEGDLIVSVGGTKLEGLTPEQAHELFHVPVGSSFTADVSREGRLTRYLISAEALRVPAAAHARVDDMTGYLTLTRFSNASVNDALRRLAAMAAKGIDKVIVDLRFNPGGDVHAAAKLAAAFLPQGAPILSMRGTGGYEDFIAPEDGPFKDLIVSVLVNRYTASASEIVTAALSENKRAVVVGEETYGKGVGQSGYALGNGGMLWVTSFHWLTPKGHNITRGQGIVPTATLTQDVDGLYKARDFIADLIFTQKPKSTDDGVNAAYRAVKAQAN